MGSRIKPNIFLKNVFILNYFWPLLLLTDLVAPQHVGFSQTRNQTCVPRIARQILNFWTTWEAKLSLLTLHCVYFFLCPFPGTTVPGKVKLCLIHLHNSNI